MQAVCGRNSRLQRLGRGQRSSRGWGKLSIFASSRLCCSFEPGIAQPGAAYYPGVMTTISLKLPEDLLARLEKVSRARRTTKSSVVRECLEQQLPDQTPPLDLPELPPGESFYDKALPVLKKAWARRGRRRRDLATNPKYMDDFGR